MTSFGEELRRQRELRSISLREISDATKINIRFLEALEQNDFKHLPGGQFNKGFIRAYARHLGVDGEEMVDAYLLELRRQDGGAPPPSRSSSIPWSQSGPARVLVPAAVAGLVLLAALVGIVLFLRSRGETAGGKKESSASAGGIPASTEGQARTSAKRPPPGAADRSAGGTEGEKTQETDSGAEPAAATPREGAGVVTGSSESSGQVQEGTPPAGNPPPGAGHASPPSELQVEPGKAAPEASGEPPSRRESAPSTAVGTAMVLQAVPLQPVGMKLQCDGKLVYWGDLQLGRGLRFECPGVFEISLADAGAVSLTLNGDRIYLGRPGQSIAGRHVSAANHADFLTPPAQEPPR